MSTHKHFDKICCVVLALTLIVALLFVNGELFGIQKASSAPGYEKALFDTSRVHTIDIVMDNWDEFTADARSEEYYTCSVVIDGEAYKNVAIRGKGNTSLSSVTNGRYSYKIEFDHYDSANNYYGLDKLALNNIIQDNTYMKDYLTYTMMKDMGVAAPLCSYAYVTVNGEDWGLYLAVEGVEESFLQRNYGKDYGELYKPDSMSMGGGRGNGDKFDMDAFMNSSDADSRAPESTVPSTEEEEAQKDSQTSPPESGSIPDGQSPEGMTPPDFSGESPFGGEFPEDMTPPDFGGNGNPFGGQASAGTSSLVSGINKTAYDTALTNLAQSGGFGGMTPPDLGGESPFGGEMPDFSQIPGGMTPPADENGSFQIPDNLSDMFGGNFGGNFGGFGGMGSSDVKLQYIDDNPDSYSNIFGNAKTDITDADEARLIEALKRLSNGEDLENTVDIEAVIRYFAVHNFVVNADSYTGTMIHNYYLYEKDGQLQMIPWDYNLAFGSFMSTGDATSSVNDPVDTPLSVSGSGDRPMIDWIFSSEEYTELYHQILSELIESYFDSGYFSQMIDSVTAMISPYDEKDPTKFCTYEEFEKGVSTLREFCLLRAESVKGQLNGTIGSTSAAQKADTLIDASHINTGDMGSMGTGFGRNMQKPVSSSPNNQSAEKKPTEPDTSEGSNSGNSRPQMPGSFNGSSMPEFSFEKGSDGKSQGQGDSFSGSEQPQYQPKSINSASSSVILGISVLILVSGIVFALKFKRRK